jgi:hypothetical protein
MITEERLEKLEQELARVNRRNRWLLTVVVLAIVGLSLASTWTKTTAIAQAQGAEAAPKVIRANKVILEDENGKPRAELSVDKDGPALRLFDENGKGCAGLSIYKDTPSLFLRDKKDQLRADLALSKNGPTLNLFDENGKARAAMGAVQTASPDGTQTKYPESSLFLFGPDGKTLWSVP